MFKNGMTAYLNDNTECLLIFKMFGSMWWVKTGKGYYMIKENDIRALQEELWIKEKK
jgi:hypothetical protein